MSELWIPSGGTNRKIKELYIPSGGINRKIKEAYAPYVGSNRRIFSAGTDYTITVSASTSNGGYAITFSDGSARFYAGSRTDNTILDYNWSISFAQPIPTVSGSPLLQFILQAVVDVNNKAKFMGATVDGYAKFGSDSDFGQYSLLSRVSPGDGSGDNINNGSGTFTCNFITAYSGQIKDLHINYTLRANGTSVREDWSSIKIFGHSITSAPTGQIDLRI